jgi:hypothetical protein
LLGIVGGAKESRELTTPEIRLMATLAAVNSSPELVAVFGNILALGHFS